MGMIGSGRTPMTDTVHGIRGRMRRSYLYPFVAACFDELHPTDRFTLNWHIDAMCHQLTRVEQGDCRRLLITVPPRHLKSITTAVGFVAWLLGRDPGKRIMVASYGDELATKHGEHCRTVMTSAWYRRLFPGDCPDQDGCVGTSDQREWGPQSCFARRRGYRVWRRRPDPGRHDEGR